MLQLWPQEVKQHLKCMVHNTTLRLRGVVMSMAAKSFVLCAHVCQSIKCHALTRNNVLNYHGGIAGVIGISFSLVT